MKGVWFSSVLCFEKEGVLFVFNLSCVCGGSPGDLIAGI